MSIQQEKNISPVYVRIADILDAAPFLLPIGNNQHKKITRFRICDTYIQFFAARARTNDCYSHCNQIETIYGEQLVLFFQEEAVRIGIRSYTHAFLPLKRKDIHDSRPAFKEEQGHIRKILYTHEETHAFYAQRKEHIKQGLIAVFFHDLSLVKEALQSFGTYQAIQDAFPSAYTIDDRLQELQKFCSKKEHAYYTRLAEETKAIMYTPDQIRIFMDEQKICETLGSLSSLLKTVDDMSDYKEILDVYTAAHVEEKYALLLQHHLYDDVRRYTQQFDRKTRRIFFT